MSGFFDMEKRFETPKLPGVTIGIVSEVGDQGNLNKVKVKLVNIEKDRETDFIRVMTPLSSKMQFMPEVGDEVLVAFCEGDMGQPYVLGCLYKNDEKQPNTTTQKNNDIKMIKTRSGHTIVFDDTQEKVGESATNKGNIEITSANGLKISLDDLQEKISLYDEEKKNMLNIDVKNGTISIEACKKLELKSTESLELSVDKSKIEINNKGIEIDSQSSVKLSGSAVSVQGRESLELRGQSSLMLKSEEFTNINGKIIKIN